MVNYQYEHEAELSLVPLEYSIDMALCHHDVLLHQVMQYNVYLLEKLMQNTSKQVPYKIRIAIFGIDGYPTIQLLESTGHSIVLTKRIVKEEVSYETYEGHSIRRLHHKSQKSNTLDYFLDSYGNNATLIARVKLS